DVAPPPASFAAWTPDLPSLEPEGPPIGEDHKDRDQEDNAEPVRELPLANAVDDEAHEAAADDAIVTYLTVHSHLTQEALPQFGRTLEALPGIRGTAVARVSDDAVEIVVAHHRDTDLLACMRSIPGLDFRLVARGEGMVEIEIL